MRIGRRLLSLVKDLRVDRGRRSRCDYFVVASIGAMLAWSAPLIAQCRGDTTGYHIADTSTSGQVWPDSAELQQCVVLYVPDSVPFIGTDTMVLYLDNRPVQSNHPERIGGRHVALMFRLARDDSSRDVWNGLIGAPKPATSPRWRRDDAASARKIDTADCAASPEN